MISDFKTIDNNLSSSASEEDNLDDIDLRSKKEFFSPSSPRIARQRDLRGNYRTEFPLDRTSRNFLLPVPQLYNCQMGAPTAKYQRIRRFLSLNKDGTDKKGWICLGSGEWGCLKLDEPRWDEKERKIIKYEHPRGVSHRDIPPASYLENWT